MTMVRGFNYDVARRRAMLFDVVRSMRRRVDVSTRRRVNALDVSKKDSLSTLHSVFSVVDKICF